MTSSPPISLTVPGFPIPNVINYTTGIQNDYNPSELDKPNHPAGVFFTVFAIFAVMLAIFSVFYKIHKYEEEQASKTSSPTLSNENGRDNAMILQIQQQLQHLCTDLASNLQVLPVITYIETIPTNGVSRSGDAGLSSNQEHEAMSISNLTADEITHIKNYCNESNLIGEGSFAKVYRGIFHGKDFAIKKIEHRYNDTKKWVENEIELLQGKEHKNINRLYAWCVEGSISYLVYMYVSGCALDDYLRGNCLRFGYSWKQCFRMIMGIAEGIEFLHRNKILHVDIKPQNIMWDANDNEVKLVDFGFSRHVDWKGTHRSTDKIVGTIGYWAPEYCLNHKLCHKHDVFSFGIVVLEMITGERHVDNARSSSQFHIPDYVRYMMANDRFEQAVDTRLKENVGDDFALENALAVANIAIRCVDTDKERRPYMDVVVRELTSIMMSNNNIVGPREEEITIIMHV